MKLKTYLEREDLWGWEFAKMAGTTSATISRIANGAIPRPDLMRRIVELTKGEVGPNDFYNLPQGDIPK